MFSRFSLVLVLTSFGHFALSAPTAREPTIKIGQATFRGTSNGKIEKYLGIPYASAPRFDLPSPINSYPPHDIIDATKYGFGCIAQDSEKIKSPQIAKVLNYIQGLAYPPEDEQCLSINIVRPANYDYENGEPLPVLVYVYGGGFTGGYSSTIVFRGDRIVDNSINRDMPVVYVTMNYRGNAFGFLASEEVRAAGVANLGLLDQRESFRWIQRNIANFGGDPKQVTIWGESAGAISVSFHFVANGGDNEGLFRGAIMQSGPIIPVGDISGGQGDYNFLVEFVGCKGAPDTLDCLRHADLEKLKDAINRTRSIWGYTSLAATWTPRVDGKWISDNPQKLLQRGFMSNVPFIMGDCDDEGTIFSYASRNVTTEDQARTYMNSLFFPTASRDDADMLFSYYSQSPANGSPYDTGTGYQLSPQFKRIASFVGDVAFQAPRRWFLDSARNNQRWTYMFRRHKNFIPYMGSFHGSDLLDAFENRDGVLMNYFLNFAYGQDPNYRKTPDVIEWKMYDPSSRAMLDIRDRQEPFMGEDTDRDEAIKFLQAVSLKYPYGQFEKSRPLGHKWRRPQQVD